MYKAIDYAIQAVDKGYFVSPACIPRVTEKGCFNHINCGNPGKVPLYRHDEITNSSEQVKRLWVKNYNILVKTQESKLIVLDLDLKADKPEGFQWIKRNLRAGRINTRSHRTGSGGTHYIYRFSGNVNHGDKICRGLDLRGDNSHHYVIWVGSRHENGRFYEVIDDTTPEEIPEWLSQEISVSKARYNPNVCTTVGETVLEQLWVAAGIPIHQIDNRRETVKYWIPCLKSDLHSSGSNPFDCVMLSGVGIGRLGSYVCQHQSHKKITTHDAIQILRSRVSEDVFNGILGKYSSKIDVASNIRTVDEASAEIGKLFDNIDDKPGRIIVAKITTGVGKTEESLKYLGNHGNQPTYYFVPFHKLAQEYVDRLEARTGILAAYPKGVTYYKDAESCVFPHMIAEASRLKLPIRQNVCVGCSHFSNYKGSGNPCKAGRSSTVMEGKHKVLQHASLDGALRNIAATGSNKVVIIDEQPELVTTQCLDLSIFDEPFEEFENVGKFKRLAELIAKAAKILKSGYATAKDVVSVGKNGANLIFDFNHETAALLEDIASNELPYPHEAAAHLSKRVTLGYTDAIRKLKRLADVFTMLYSLRTACTYSNRETFQFINNRVILRTPATWIVEANTYAKNGGTVLLMSASANTEVLKEVLGESAEFINIHASDYGEVHRQFRYDNQVSRSKLLTDGYVNQGLLRGALSRIYEDLVEFGGIGETLIVTHKPIADVLRNRGSDFLPIGWNNQIDAGGILHIAHYGNILGLDCYKQCDAVITLGDPIMNIGVAEAESRAVGVRFEEYLSAKTQGELMQSHGRLRASRRKTPALILHVGMRKPDVAMAPQWSRFLVPTLG